METDPFAAITAILGGWRIKTTPWCHVDVMLMFGGNHRIVETYLDEFRGYRRGWCFAGPAAREASFLAALAWDGRPNTEPTGWVKEVSSGRRRPGGDPARETSDWVAPETRSRTRSGSAVR